MEAMQKLFSQIIGKPVFDEFSVSPVALVHDVLIDPENGHIVAFLVSRKRVVVPFDITRFSSAALYIADRDSLTPPEDVLRVREVLRLNIPILGAKVTNMHNVYIGKVVDFEIDTKTMSLSHIFTAKTIFFFHTNDRTFARKQIISITKKGIQVKDDAEVKVKEPKTLPCPAIS